MKFSLALFPVRRTLTVALLGMGLPFAASTAVAQTTASSSMKAPSWAAPVGYDLGDTGVEQRVSWGIDTAWDWDWWPLRATNHMQECVSLGRVTLDPRVDQVYSSLSSDQSARFDKQLGWLKKSGVKSLYLLAGNTTGRNWSTSWRAAYINDIALAVKYLQSKGYVVTCISPFNEPDYSANHAPDAAEQAAVARQMRQNAVLASIDVCGPSTLSPDYGLAWWREQGSAWQVGNTHQLSGSSTNFADFYAAVRASGKKSTGDEMHNINDALVGMEYGMSEGIWWSDYGGYTRAELGRASNDGVRVGWMENRTAFTSAAVFRRKSQQLAEVFMGSSERQAADASYTFVSQDRLVYYDGEGPTYDFTAGTPGGTGYQTGQTNAETVVELTYGEDIPAGPIHGGTFKIVNKATGKLLTASALSNSAGVSQQKESSSANQTWVITPLAPRDAPDFAYVTIHNAKSSSKPFYLDAVKWAANNGAGICVYAGGGNECERWHLRYMGDGYYVITNHDSGLSLEGSAANSDANTTAVVQWARTGTDRQLWRLVPASAKVETDAPAVPVGLTATGLSGSIRLEWTANDERDLLGYMIYRYNTVAGLWECIARQVTDNQFIDNSCPKGTTQRYRIRAIDNAWNLSEATAEVSAATTTDPVLLGQWLLGTSLDDNSENRLDAVSTDVTFATQGSHSGAVFNGSTGYLALPYNVSNCNAMTFSAWVRPTTTTAWQRIFDFGRNTENYVMLTPTNGSVLRFEICKDGVKQGVNATKRLSASAWTHVAVTLGDDGARIYLNGELNASSAEVTFRPSDVRPLLSYIGRSMFASDPLFRGTIGDICLYNHVLSADAIRGLMYHDQIALAGELLTKPMYNVVRNDLQQSISDAETTIADNASTESIQAALTTMKAKMEDARASIAIYEPLVEALDASVQLADAYVQQQAGARADYDDAYSTILENCMEGSYTHDEIPAQLIALETVTNRYLMADATVKATEDAPVTITHVLSNSDFAAGLDHWTLTTGDDKYQGDFYETSFEVFNHPFVLSQVLYGMPSGKYYLGAQGFYRCGPKEDIETATDANAVLFIGEETGELNLISRGANSRTAAGDWYGYASNKNVPNDLQAAYAAFTALNRYRPGSVYNFVQGTYDAEQGQPLVVGLRKDAAVSQDWTVVHNFTLRYLGGSTETGIDKVERSTFNDQRPTVYDLTGRPVAAPTKGLYIVGGKKVMK